MGKTNVMRILEKEKIPYTAHSYSAEDGVIDGVGVAKKLGQKVEAVFKTLVTRNEQKFFVFVVPVAKELDLKKAAKAAGQKTVEMVHVKELLGITGYIRGGCSPIGMKKRFLTIIDESAQGQETIMVSGGKIGTQVELAPQNLAKLIGANFASITKEA